MDKCAYVTTPRQLTIHLIAQTFAYQSRTMQRKAQRLNAETKRNSEQPAALARKGRDNLEVHPRRSIGDCPLMGQLVESKGARLPEAHEARTRKRQAR